MNIVCPGDVTVNTWRTRPQYMLTLYENLWHVDKAGYDKCEVNKDGKLLLVCNSPKNPKKLQFSFHPIYSNEEPRFAPGKHYYFISTSNGIQYDLTTRRTSGDDGHCIKYHMKLHIYVCNPKEEDCIWEPPQCDTPAEIKQRMLMINGKLPRPTRQQMQATEPRIPATKRIITQAVESTTKKRPGVVAQKIETECKNESATSVHAVMNFVLGGVIVFLIAVVIILACALAKRSKPSKLQKVKLPTETKQPRIYESVPVQLPPNMMIPVGPPQSDYLVYTRPCTPDPLYHAVIRTPSHHNYEAPVFRFPDVPQRSRRSSIQRSRAGSAQAKCSIEREDNMDSVSV
ncbi:angiopoietin-related 7-like [Paramuricea clavata]|uniref:Angiopoietin-related 7-like n=1 Tax=Paramuricea clavata TaxID=317549 RepID=A0A6S7ICL9_PARCT|nr:angiopoietin-related 7-like [Paramuricea clavata]